MLEALAFALFLGALHGLVAKGFPLYGNQGFMLVLFAAFLISR